MLPARELPDAADLAIDGAEARPVPLAPDHALMIGGRDLAAPLDQGAVGIEEKLCVVQGSAVTLVHADGHDDSRLPGGIADGVRGGGRHRHGLVEQLQLLGSDDFLDRGLDPRKVRVVRHHGLRERGELYPLPAEFVNLPHDLFDRPLTAIEHWAQLDCGGFDDSHLKPPCLTLRYRSDLNAARSSAANSSGCSHAAKWPPLSTLL